MSTVIHCDNCDNCDKQISKGVLFCSTWLTVDSPGNWEDQAHVCSYQCLIAWAQNQEHARAAAMKMIQDQIEKPVSDQERQELLDLMSAWSEERYTAAWTIGLEATLHQPGSVWEAISRHYGGIWPQEAYGDDGQTQWTTWDDFKPTTQTTQEASDE